MRYASKPGYVREAIGVFGDAAELEATIDELQESGFNHAELSLLAHESAVERELGHYYERPAEIEDDPEAPRIAYVERESIGAAEGALISGPLYVAAITAAGLVVAAGGPVMVALATASVAGGAVAIFGTALARMVGERHARHIKDQLERGGIVLWVNLRDAEHERIAMDILRRHSAGDIHVHEVPGPH